MIVGMLAAETPSMDGHLAASTPRRKGEAASTAGKLQHAQQLAHTPVITRTKSVIVDTQGVNKSCWQIATWLGQG